MSVPCEVTLDGEEDLLDWIQTKTKSRASVDDKEKEDLLNDVKDFKEFDKVSSLKELN